MTVKHFAVLKKGFVDNSDLFSEENKLRLGNMAIDRRIMQDEGGYKSDFFKSRTDSQTTRIQANDIRNRINSNSRR